MMIETAERHDREKKERAEAEISGLKFKLEQARGGEDKASRRKSVSVRPLGIERRWARPARCATKSIGQECASDLDLY